MVETSLRIDHEHFKKIVKNESDRRAIIDAIEFFIKELGIDGHANVINFRAKRYNSVDACGECCNDKKCPKTYWVMFMGKSRKASRNITTIVETIAHELIHVKQYLFDGLYEATKQNNEAGANKVPYRDTWWEKEAWNGQEPLVIKFVDHINAVSDRR
jgi:hypothetical protein